MTDQDFHISQANTGNSTPVANGGGAFSALVPGTKCLAAAAKFAGSGRICRAVTG